MKHVEQIKAFVLLFLVLLSLVLTFLIWTYTPDYQTIEEAQGENKKISTDKEKELDQVINPYRMLVHENQNLSGTVESAQIDKVISALSQLNATEPTSSRRNISEDYFNKMINSGNRMTLFYPDEVPINTFRSILNFPENVQLNNVSFSHLIIDYSQTGKLKLYFLSEKNRTLYTMNAAMGARLFAQSFSEVIQNTVRYIEVQREGEFSLYLPENPVELWEYHYYMDEIPLESFEEALFKNPNIVQKNIENETSTNYNDESAIMEVDTKRKTIKYAYPDAEGIHAINRSDLIQDSLDFLNNHGGLTGDYRYAYSNPEGRIIKYQLFFQDLPVFSGITSTRISMEWGEYQIFRYERPYFKFGVSVETFQRQLPAGSEIVDNLSSLENVDEILVGYSLEKHPEKRIYILKPSWFVIKDGVGIPIPTETLGGTADGLE
ncbi:YycH family regulatory protein [Lysinibacillus yapensis]|uniref:YycH family regulatory protein n=1 Tax=Ureibacillus yapensis TaxID=2304605 RepID=UPI001F2607B3|nr:two-component system activity regulator YycH [Lysinibacillus yapensis]